MVSASLMSTSLDFPFLIKQIRDATGLTQEQLARELGVTFGTVNGWENGKHRPSPLAARQIVRTAAGSGVVVGESFDGADRSPADPTRAGGTRRTRRNGGR